MVFTISHFLLPPEYVLGQLYNGRTQSNLAVKQAIRTFKQFPCLFIPEQLTLGMKAFSADGSMAELFDSTAAACRPGKSFVRPFFFSHNLTPWPEELYSSCSDYFREQVLWKMLRARMQLKNLF